MLAFPFLIYLLSTDFYTLTITATSKHRQSAIVTLLFTGAGTVKAGAFTSALVAFCVRETCQTAVVLCSAGTLTSWAPPHQGQNHSLPLLYTLAMPTTYANLQTPLPYSTEGNSPQVEDHRSTEKRKKQVMMSSMILPRPPFQHSWLRWKRTWGLDSEKR